MRNCAGPYVRLWACHAFLPVTCLCHKWLTWCVCHPARVNAALLLMHLRVADHDGSNAADVCASVIAPRRSRR